MKEKKKFKIRKIFKSRVLFFIFGALIFGTIGVGAASVLYSKDVTYDNSNSGLSATTVQDALDELYEQAKNSGDILVPIPLGSYVLMTPTLTTYSTNADYVGGDDYVTTINPSELNLWQIVHKNNDGTIDIVSVYVSSSKVTFYGKIGYQNLVGQLNLLASAYENSAYTISSRYLGYSNQTEFCSNYITSACPPDTNYTIDINYLEDAGVSLKTYMVDTTNATGYWLPSRVHYYCNNSTCEMDTYYGRLISSSGVVTYENYWLYSDKFYNASKSLSFALRPIVTLKSTVKVSGGSGTASDPYTLSVG